MSGSVFLLIVLFFFYLYFLLVVSPNLHDFNLFYLLEIPSLRSLTPKPTVMLAYLAGDRWTGTEALRQPTFSP